MSEKFLTYSEVDTTIQNEMANQAPSESKRLDAIDTVVRDLNTKYDIETTRRSVSISVIPNGKTSYTFDSLVDDDDVKRVADIRFASGDDVGKSEFRYIDDDLFTRHAIDSVRVNEWTTYYEDGDQYLKVNTVDGETTSQTMTMKYYSFFNYLDDSTFKETLKAESTYKILLPKRFKSLVVAGVKRILWSQSLGGRDGDANTAISNNKYKSELKRLGLDDTGVKAMQKQKKVKLHSSW